MPNSSILAGAEDLINAALELEDVRLKYHHKERCQLLSKGPKPDFDGKALIQKILAQIELKWDKSESPSDQNWRWKKNPKLKTESEEVVLRSGSVCLNNFPRLISGLRAG